MQINSRGVGLIVALGVIMLIISLALLAVNFTLSNFKLFNYTINTIKAFTFAEAGIQRSMYKIKNGTPNSESWDFSGQTIAITIDPPTPVNTYNVTSIGPYRPYSNVTKTISAKVALDTTTTPNKVILLEWKQKD